MTNRRPVCGVNGQTYPSSCHAKGAGIAIDYIGQCSAVPNTTGMLNVVCDIYYYNILYLRSMWMARWKI